MDLDDIFDENSDDLTINENDWKKMIASRKMVTSNIFDK